MLKCLILQFSPVNTACLQVRRLGRPECETTWEPATALSSAVVDNYEAGLLTETSTECSAMYGHTSTTLVVNSALQKPALKKSKKERFCQDDENGYIEFYYISVDDSIGTN